MGRSGRTGGVLVRRRWRGAGLTEGVLSVRSCWGASTDAASQVAVPRAGHAAASGGKTATQTPGSQSCSGLHSSSCRGVGPQPCAPRLAFPFLTSFSGSLNCCRGGQGNQVGSCSGISHRPGSTGTMPFVLSLGTPGSSGQQLWPAVIPGHRGFLSSACPHEPCDRELATCPQAGSWASAPHSPVRERAGMPRAGSGLETSVPAPSSGQRSPPASLAGATVRKTPFSLWALSGQALGLRGQVGGVSHILHLRCHYSQQSLMWSQSSTEIMCPGVPQRCFSCYCVTNAPSGTWKQNGPRGSHEGDSGGRATAGPPRTTTPLSRPQRPLL